MSVRLTPIASGQNVGLTLHMTPLPVAVEPCVPSITGVFWFSDESGAFDAMSEAAYLMDGEPAGPVAAVALLAGETCGQTVWWIKEWTPDDEGGGSPLYLQADPYLFVYVDADTAPGTLNVSASCDGRTYGPIVLTMIAAAGGGGACPPSFWKIEDNSDTLVQNTFSGYGNPVPDGVVLQAGRIEVSAAGDFDFSVFMRSPGVDIVDWAIDPESPSGEFPDGDVTLTMLDEETDGARVSIQIENMTAMGPFDGRVTVLATDANDVEWKMTLYVVYRAETN